MQEQLENDDILMHSIFNESKSVIADRFLKSKLEAKINKKMTAIDIKSYLSYLNNLIDQYSNTYHHSFGKKPIDADYSVLREKIQTNPKAPNYKVNDSVRITQYKNICSKGFTESWVR